MCLVSKEIRETDEQGPVDHKAGEFIVSQSYQAMCRACELLLQMNKRTKLVVGFNDRISIKVFLDFAFVYMPDGAVT